MEMYIGTIIAWPISFAPRGWMFCQGQLLQIAQYTALYSLIGNIYGGDGRTTFALPDLRGRVPVGAGQYPGQSNYQIGQAGGSETVALTAAQMPAHTHAQPASTKAATVGQPGPSTVPGAYEKERGAYYNIYSPQADANTTLAPAGNTGGNQPHNNMQPYIALNYIICIEGLYPPRD
jgi:microcystin-dependent protein